MRANIVGKTAIILGVTLLAATKRVRFLKKKEKLNKLSIYRYMILSLPYLCI